MVISPWALIGNTFIRTGGCLSKNATVKLNNKVKKDFEMTAQ